jgi:hypothetical protein
MKAGDMVRVIVESGGRQEYHYGRIGHFVKADGLPYRRSVARPYGARVELTEHSPVRRPMTEITPVADDFDVVTDHDAVHRGAWAGGLGVLWCLGCPRPNPMPAAVLVIHRATGVRTRLCEGHNTHEQWARLGHQPLWDARQCQDTIARLASNPQEIAGPAGGEAAEQARRWADAFPYLVPPAAAQRYAEWKEHQSHGAA